MPPLAEADQLERLVGAGAALRLVDALERQRVRGVVPDAAVRQQREVLEHHADLLLPDGPQLGRGDGAQVVVAEQHAPGGRLQQAVEHPDQGRLPGPRQPHDHEGLAAADLEVGVDHRRRPPLPHVLAGGPVAEPLHRLARPAAEHLVHALDAQSCHFSTSSRHDARPGPCGSGAPGEGRGASGSAVATRRAPGGALARRRTRHGPRAAALVRGAARAEMRASHTDRSSIWSGSTVPHLVPFGEARSCIFGG
jgi:hypothetical protein